MQNQTHILTPWFFADALLCETLGLRNTQRALCRINNDRIETVRPHPDGSHKCHYGAFLLNPETLTIKQTPYVEFDTEHDLALATISRYIPQRLIDRLNPRDDEVRIATPVGTLVAEYFGQPGDYDGIAIDFTKENGDSTQVCVAEYDRVKDELHTLAWNGDDENPVAKTVVNRDGEYVY